MRPLADYLDTHKWDAESLWAYVKQDLETMGSADYAPVLRKELDKGWALLLIDGLDTVLAGSEPEIEARREQIDALLVSLERIFPDTRLALTIRNRALDESWRPATLHVVKLQPLADNWQPQGLRAGKVNFEEARGRQGALVKYFLAFDKEEISPNGFIRAEAAGELPVIERLARMLNEFDEDLAGNPRFVAVMASLHKVRYGMLYRRIVSLLLQNEHEMLAEVFKKPLADAQEMALQFLFAARP